VGNEEAEGRFGYVTPYERRRSRSCRQRRERGNSHARVVNSAVPADRRVGDVILLTVKKKGYKMLKVISACLVTLTLAGTVLGFEPQDVTTTDGKIFKQVTAVRMVRDKVVLIYADGTTFVPIASLSDDTRKSLGLRSRAEQSAFDAEQKQKELAAFEAAQIKKGLVKVGDEWITAKQKAMRDEEDKL